MHTNQQNLNSMKQLRTYTSYQNIMNLAAANEPFGTNMRETSNSMEPFRAKKKRREEYTLQNNVQD